jgi:hypothetical protein
MVLTDRIAPAIENPKETVAMTTTHRIGTTAVLLLSLAAVSAPAASAMPIGPDAATAANGQPSTAAIYSRQDKSSVPVNSRPTAKVSTRATIVRLQAPASGFDWGDAGIGAAGGLALSMIGLGGALVVSQHHTRRTRHPTA